MISYGDDYIGVIIAFDFALNIHAITVNFNLVQEPLYDIPEEAADATAAPSVLL